MGSVRVAIVGVGNCASSLVQGVEYYKDAVPGGRVPGLMHVQFGPYHVRDVEFVAAFDVDAKKVGRDLAEAIGASENNTIKICDVPQSGVTVQRGHTLDGLAGGVRLRPRRIAELLQSLRVGEIGHCDLTQVDRAAVGEPRLHDAARVDADAGELAGREAILGYGRDAEVIAILRGLGEIKGHVHRRSTGGWCVGGEGDRAAGGRGKSTGVGVSECLLRANGVAIHVELRRPGVGRRALDEIECRGVSGAE